MKKPIFFPEHLLYLLFKKYHYIQTVPLNPYSWPLFTSYLPNSPGIIIIPRSTSTVTGTWLISQKPLVLYHDRSEQGVYTGMSPFLLLFKLKYGVTIHFRFGDIIYIFCHKKRRHQISYVTVTQKPVFFPARLLYLLLKIYSYIPFYMTSAHFMPS